MMQGSVVHCRSCGQIIHGNYVQALGASWHPEHFVCTHCHRPLGHEQFVLHQNAPYHQECYRQSIAPRCSLCNKPLEGQFIVDYWDNKYCVQHQQQYPSCAFCGRLVPSPQPSHPAERVVCSVCRSSAVETVEEARPLFNLVKQWFSQQQMTFHSLPVHLDLCGPEKLQRLLGQQNIKHALGATSSQTYTQDGRVIRSSVDGIAVLRGLPATLFQGVAVHELGHVWLLVHDIRNLTSWAEEGWCELLSHRYYQDHQSVVSRYHAEMIERNPDPVYGEGFRRVQALANRIGFPRFVEILRTTRQLPR